MTFFLVKVYSCAATTTSFLLVFSNSGLRIFIYLVLLLLDITLRLLCFAWSPGAESIRLVVCYAPDCAATIIIESGSYCYQIELRS